MMKKLFTLLALCLSFSYHSSAQCTAEIIQTGPYLVCQFSNTTLNATPGGTVYQWLENGVAIPGANADTYVVPTGITGPFTYTVEITFNTCTDISDPLSVIVKPTPQTTAFSNSPVCEGEIIDLEMSFLVPLMGATFQWYGPSSFTSTLQGPDIPNAQPINAGTYTLNVTYDGCTATPTTTFVVINPTPVLTTASSNSPVCAGSTLELTANTIPGVTYSWTGPFSFNSFVQNPSVPNVQPNYSGTYSVVATLNGCASQPLSTNVVVNSTPNISVTYIDPTYPNTFDGSLTIHGLVSFQAYTISFTKDGIPQAPMTAIPGGGTFTLSNLSEGVYSDIVVILNGCASNPAGPITLVAQNPLPDYVWPGDVNDDHFADNNDVLDIGLSYGQTGPVRSGASLNWVGQISTDWGVPQVSGADMKHADCDGNGTVDATDVDAINQNYGQYHPKGVHTPKAKSASLPDLYFDFTGITFQAGTTVDIPIKLGSSAMPMNDILGIAAQVIITNVSLDNASTITNNMSWLGNSGNTIHFTKPFLTYRVDWAYVRTDHTNVSGEGTIATLTMEIPADAPAQDAVLYFDNVKIINSAGDVLTDYNVVDDTATIIPVSIKSAVSTTPDKAAIVPNPSAAHADLQITLSEASDVQITITDMTGRMVWNETHIVNKGTQNIQLPVELASGIYTIQVAGTKGITLPAMKWMKK